MGLGLGRGTALKPGGIAVLLRRGEVGDCGLFALRGAIVDGECGRRKRWSADASFGNGNNKIPVQRVLHEARVHATSRKIHVVIITITTPASLLLLLLT